MRPTNYLDFELKFARNGRRYVAHVYKSPAGEASVEFKLPFSALELENLILRLTHLRTAARRIDSPEMEAARKIGSGLFQAVFQGIVRDCLRASLAEARSQSDRGLRLKLRLNEVPTLANLPWEFLFDPDMGRFLAKSIQTPLIRYIELPESVPPLKASLPIRVLGMISNPSDYPRLNVEHEKTLVMEAIDPLLRASNVTVNWLEQATLPALLRALRSSEYHIFHYIGHGGFDTHADQGVLIMEDERGLGSRASAEQLGDLFHDHPSMRLAILNTCEGARNSPTDPFAGVATSLVRQGLPAVVAMQFEISDKAALIFASEFYTALIQGFPVDAAVAEARKAISLQPDDVEWGTPVLYMRAANGVLFDLPETPSPQEAQTVSKLVQVVDVPQEKPREAPISPTSKQAAQTPVDNQASPVKPAETSSSVTLPASPITQETKDEKSPAKLAPSKKAASTGPINKASSTDRGFFTGVNYPWIAYGLDFGQNAWGHQGLSSSGWTCQTYPDCMGFTSARIVREMAHSGKGALCITANLKGQDKHRQQGEVYVDLTRHAPHGVTAPLDMTDKAAHFWLYFPPGSSGAASARNGVQIVLKSLSRDGTSWHSWYSSWTYIRKEWEGTYQELSSDPIYRGSFREGLFDPSQVVAIGVKVAIHSASLADLKGNFYLDDVQLDTNPPIRFDFEQTEIEKDLATLSSKTNLLRVFVFGDGRASPEFAAAGAVATPGFDDFFFQDFDFLIQAAAYLNFKLIPVLLDFRWCQLENINSGVKMGGHSTIIRDADKRQTFLDNALKPLIQRYVHSPQIFSWEIINEPEWVISELNPGDETAAYVSLQQMRDFIKACTDTIHAANPALWVTVGSARRKWVSQWKGLGLDLYQFHWYENMAAEEPFPWPPCQDLSLDKPCFIGEVPTATTNQKVEDYLKAAQNGGYRGLLVWSYRSADSYSDFSKIKEQFINSSLK